MIWLASFPRSGNTFFRNVLFEVYGIESSTYHKDPDRQLDEDFDSYKVIKTHLLPNELPKDLQKRKAVYLIRDGRDALVSMAHHRKDIVEPGSDFYNNLLTAILAPNGSHFGGWSENVKQWTEKAAIVIRFEDLIKNPIGEIEKLRGIMDLPEPDPSKLPSFKQLKFGQPKYGGGSGPKFNETITKKNFRKGKSGGWKEEMPTELQYLFGAAHNKMMSENSYNDELTIHKNTQNKKVLIEISKLHNPLNDGVKRYLLELLTHMPPILKYLPEWEIGMLNQYQIQPFQLNEEFFSVPPEATDNFLLKIKGIIQKVLPSFIYDPLSSIYRSGPFRRILLVTMEFLRSRKLAKTINTLNEQLQNFDLVHVPLPQNLTQFRNTDVPFIVTAHDITHKIFPDFHTKTNTRNAEQGMGLIVEKEPNLIAISEATKKDLIDHYSYPAEKIDVIYEGAAGKFNRKNQENSIDKILKSYELPHTPYFITLSTLEPRKNISNTISAFKKLKVTNPDLNIALFICGEKGWKYNEILGTDKGQLQEMGIYFTGFVAEEDLPNMFAHAKALCYISHYEGFGLPLLEAMQSGTPVIYGNNSSMPEVVGRRGGIAVDSHNVEAITQAMQTILTNKELYEQLAEGAWEQSTKFSWLRAAFETFLAYDKAIENSSKA